MSYLDRALLITSDTLIHTDMSSAWTTALAALQSSIAILLIIAAGYVCRKRNFLTETGESQITSLCNSIFLPALLVSQVGPNFSLHDSAKIVPIFIFAAAEMAIGYVVGKIGERYFKFPRWITPSLMFNNTTSLPLLLARDLKDNGIMDALLMGKHDTPGKALDRMESYILINAVFHSVLRFGLGPRLMNEKEEYEEVNTEREPLIPRQRGEIKSRLGGVYRTVKSWLNPALSGALVAIILGVIPFTHTAFFSSGGAFKSNLMQAVKQLGDLIPALLPFAVGSKLFSKPASNSGWLAMAYLILFRFVVLPGLCVLAVWQVKLHYPDLWIHDPAFDFALMISGAGPPAITMISVVEMASGSSELVGQVVRMLMFSYIATPALAATVVAGLAVIQAVYK